MLLNRSYQTIFTVLMTAASLNLFSSPIEVPLHFEKNHGQTDSRALFLAKTPSASVFFTKEQVILASKTSSIALKFIDQSSNLMPEGEGLLKGKIHYIKGSSAKESVKDVEIYEKVIYKNLYDGVDLAFYGNPKDLEFDLILAQGVSPDAIRLKVEGSQDLVINESGSIEIMVDNGDSYLLQKPLVYQEINGKRTIIESSYTLLGSAQIGFNVGNYDSSKTLVIDPIVVAYCTYLGGSSSNYLSGLVIDSAGNFYTTGATSGTDYPVTVGAFQTTLSGSNDAYVSKIDPTGSTLVYSTYFGGTLLSSNINSAAIAVDSSQSAYITGSTTDGLPTTTGAFSTTYGGGSSNAFITKFSPDGSSLVYSTYLGGNSNDFAQGIKLDSTGSAYVVGGSNSIDFPTTPGAFQTTQQTTPGMSSSFVTKLSPDGSSLVYSTLYGGTNQSTYGISIALDSSNNAYITGNTSSPNLPLLNPFQATQGEFYTSFVTKFNSTGSALVYSTYLGGSMDANLGSGSTSAGGIYVDSSGNAYVTGGTIDIDFPVFNAFQPTFGGNANTTNAFLIKFLPAGNTVEYSTYLGGSGFGGGALAIAVDSSGSPIIAGTCDSPDFPVTPDAYQSTSQSSSQGFYTKFSPSGTSLIFSTYFGGTSVIEQISAIALDPSEKAYFAGITDGPLPITPNAVQSTFLGSNQNFIARFGPAVTIEPPSALQGIQVYNRFVAQTDITNKLKWQAPTAGDMPVAYRIYRDAGLTQLIAEVETTKYSDHNRLKGVTYTYYVVSVNSTGSVSTPAVITIIPKNCL